jgi:hypothetical protein
MRLIAGESVLLSRHIPEPKKISPSKLDLRQMSRVRSEIVRFAKVRSITIEGGEK